ncbi:MAG: AAA family ATPase, partial [Oscillospiraceae bacterium]
SGKYCSFLLWGEKGVGKTYILNSFLSQTDLSGVAVFSGTCHQTSSSAPFEPWNTIMLSAAEYILANSIQIPEPVRNAVSDIFSVFSENFDSRNHIPPRKCSPVHIDNIAMFFSILSRRKKLVFVLENIHFIDSASMELLDALLRRMNSNQIMFILTCRDFLSAFIKRSLVTQLEDKLLSKIDIGCFSFEDTVLTLRSELGEQITDNLARRVYEETSGNPFLISELVASITKNGSLNELSLSTNNIMEQRLSGLSVQSRQLIDIISLFPDHAPCELLSSITDKSPNELLNLYEELKSRSLVEELCVCDESVLSFTHSKMRDFIYQSQSYFKRKSLHLRVARLLEREYTDSDGRLCSRLIYHFASGADVVNEVKYRILGLEMYSSTMHQYPSVLLENSNMPVPKDVDMQSYIVQLCSSLDELHKKNEDPLLIERLEGIMLCIKGRWGIFSGNYNLALDAIGKILSDPTFQLDTSFTLEAYFLLTLYSSRINDMEQMERRIAAGMSLGESAGNGAEIARFMLLRGYYFLRLGEFDRSAYYVAEAMERFMRLQNSRRYRMFIMSAYHYLGEIKRKQKDFAGACNEYKMGVSVLSGITHIPGIAAMYTDYGRAALALDDHTKARELFRTACDIYNVTGELFGKAMAFAYNGYYLALEGNYDASVESLKRAGDYAAIGGIVQDNGIYWCILAQLRQRLDMAYTHNNALDLFLQKPLTLYCKKGIKLLSEDPYAYELETLKKCLYYGINKERPYTTDELYSKNKNFLTE